MGPAEKRAPGPLVADLAGEEAALHPGALRLQVVPDLRDHAQAAGQPPEGGPDLHLRAAAGHPGQPDQDVQRHPGGPHDAPAQREGPPLLRPRLVPRRRPGEAEVVIELIQCVAHQATN